MAEITRQSAVDGFNGNVRNRVGWNYSSSNVPGRWSGYDQSDQNNGNFGPNPGYMGAGNVSGGIITANTFATNVRDWIYNNLSQVRNIQIIHRNRGENANINGDNWYKAVCNTGFRQGVGLDANTLGIGVGRNIGGINWANAFNVWNSLSGNRAFTITNTRYQQYGDHGSRVRR